MAKTRMRRSASKKGKGCGESTLITFCVLLALFLSPILDNSAEEKKETSSSMSQHSYSESIAPLIAVPPTQPKDLSEIRREMENGGGE